MPDRFHCENLAGTGTVELSGPEAHHLLHVLRARPGDRVELFDGSGGVADAEVVSTSKRNVTLELKTLRREPRSGGPHITIAVAFPKADRAKWMVEKLTELGVDRIIPLKTERTVVDPKGGKLEKLRQTAITACKQSRRVFLPEIEPPRSLDELLEESDPETLVVLHPGLPLTEEPLSFGDRVVFVIGPEGGLTDAEVDRMMTAGASGLTLGENILRIETAALAVTALARFR